MIRVIGKTVAEAKSELYELKLGIREAGSEASDEYEKGQIVRQDIEEGTLVDVNTTVYVYVSTGAAEVGVPNVEGYDSDAAMNMITDAGFHPARDYAYSDTVASGKVISQDPKAGEPAKKGDTVTIMVSQGKEAVVVPDVYNKPQEQATNELTQAGLSVSSVSTAYSDTVAAGNVMEQSIASGKYVDKGTNITIVVSAGSNKSYYFCKATISLPPGREDDVASADITLVGSDGQQIQSWPDTKRFPITITASDIENCDSGTIKITWYLKDGTSSNQSQDVIFTKQ